MTALRQKEWVNMYKRNQGLVFCFFFKLSFSFLFLLISRQFLYFIFYLWEYQVTWWIIWVKIRINCRNMLLWLLATPRRRGYLSRLKGSWASVASLSGEETAAAGTRGEERSSINKKEKAYKKKKEGILRGGRNITFRFFFVNLNNFST